VRDEIKGKSAKELESELLIWRRCSVAYQSGDAEDGRRSEERSLGLQSVMFTESAWEGQADSGPID
jgi:hypothetical protein